MSEKSLEAWYDKTYEMYLLSVQARKYVGIKQSISKLKLKDEVKIDGRKEK